MQPLRILHSEAATAFGGQEHRIFKEMVAMRERGHHMEAVVQSRAQLVERLGDAGFTVHKVDMAGVRNYFKGIAAIKRILRAGHYDVLNTHSRRDTVIAERSPTDAKSASVFGFTRQSSMTSVRYWPAPIFVLLEALMTSIADSFLASQTNGFPAAFGFVTTSSLPALVPVER